MATSTRTTFTLQKDVEIAPTVSIQSQGPRAIPVTGRGMVDIRELPDQYVVSGKKPLPYVFVLNRTAEIDSWSLP
ncbi:MAG: hypothetical protein AAGA62_05790, partial [Bacteroidota bacterium]